MNMERRCQRDYATMNSERYLCFNRCRYYGPMFTVTVRSCNLVDAASDNAVYTAEQRVLMTWFVKIVFLE